jgi:hypothetical protein
MSGNIRGTDYIAVAQKTESPDPAGVCARELIIRHGLPLREPIEPKG